MRKRDILRSPTVPAVTTHGPRTGPTSMNEYVHPSKGAAAQVANGLANSRWLQGARRALLQKLPCATLESDITDVVFLNWIVPVELVEADVPEGVSLIQRGGLTLLTVMNYTNGNFGPAFAKAARKAFPSPHQSTWRLYVSQLPEGIEASRTTLVVHSVLSNGLYAVGSRLLSDAQPTHHAGRFEHAPTEQGFRTVVERGHGSAPDFVCETAFDEAHALPKEFGLFFSSWKRLVRRVCRQDMMVAQTDGVDQLARVGMSLPIDLYAVRPMRTVEYKPGAMLRALGATRPPVAFSVPSVKYTWLYEHLG